MVWGRHDHGDRWRSRIYLGPHWLTDVLGGLALGATWLAAVVAVMLVMRAQPRGQKGREELAKAPPHRGRAKKARAA